MGCSSSKLDDEEAVQLCKDRKRFIKQAVESRKQFAAGHIAYIEAMEKVSAALRDYIEGDEPREFLLHTLPTPPLKKTSTGFISISPKSFSVTPIQFEPQSTLKINYLQSGGTASVSVEERPGSPETVRLEAFSPVHQFGGDGFFGMQSSPMNSSFFQYSPNNRANIAPPSPQMSQWDFFWNPFSSLDYYGYPSGSSLDQMTLDSDNDGLRQVREEEGIPELEEETEAEEETQRGVNAKQVKVNANPEFDKDEVIVEDVDDSDEDGTCDEISCQSESDHEIQGAQPHGSQTIEVSRAQNAVNHRSKETAVGSMELKEETPGFTVYVKKRPTSMAEVIKELEEQFKVACASAREVSIILEASRVQYSSASKDLTVMKILNPIELIRSASSRSASARFLISSSASEEERNESTSDDIEEVCLFSGSHQSTLDRLYAWEKKLYQEVREGERVRIQYEKKCAQLRNQDVKGEDPFSVDKTRSVIRDLHTQIKVRLHSIQAISKRIETLRNEELQPQLSDLIQGLAKMWKIMVECHQLQKHTLDEAKILLAGMPSKQQSGIRKYTVIAPSQPHMLARSAANLETQLRHWRACFSSWITSQRSYVHALAGWLLRCVRPDPDTSRLAFSPRRSIGAPPIIGVCIQWSRFLDAIHEAPVLDGLDFFAAGVGHLYSQQLSEDWAPDPGVSRQFVGRSMTDKEIIQVDQIEDEVMTAEKMAEVAIRVLCAGMSVAVSSLAEFAIIAAEGYSDLMKQWDDKQGREKELEN